MRSWLSLLALMGGLVGLARPAHAQCDVDPPNFTFTNGRPHVYETAATYGTANCAYEIVDVTYKALSPLPGTYLSWADSDFTTAAACATAKISAKVWDRTTSPPVYKGELSSVGVWMTNPDPASNPGDGICHVAPIRFETPYSITAGRKYRFAVRAYRTTQKGMRDFVLANAAVPTPYSGCGSVGGGSFCALPTSSGATNSFDRWPTRSFRLKLQSPDKKVAQGGDLFFQDGAFFQPHRTYQLPEAENFGYSNAALLYKGNFASLDAFTCGDFVMLNDIYSTPQYSYLDQESALSSTTAGGSGYCVLNARNNSLYRVWVEKSASNLIVVGFRWDRDTNRAAWGCLDGMCDADARVASQFMRYTTTERDSFVKRQFDLFHQSRSCIEGAFQRRLPVPLSMSLHGERQVAQASNSTSFGLGGPTVVVVGFQGYKKAGTKRIEDPRDIRFELHESTHTFNSHLFAGALPAWFNEGLAIQTTRLTCGGSPDYLPDFWRAWSAGNTDPHDVGSEFFKRLETDYACDVTCTYGLWRTLVDTLGADTAITSTKVKAVMEQSLGRSLTPLFTTLGIAY